MHNRISWLTASKARLRKRSVVVRQARIGSLRLLSKMLKTLAGQTILRRAGIILQSRDWICVRGSESDVLSRYAMAAQTARADAIVRIPSIPPFLSAYSRRQTATVRASNNRLHEHKPPHPQLSSRTRLQNHAQRHALLGPIPSGRSI